MYAAALLSAKASHALKYVQPVFILLGRTQAKREAFKRWAEKQGALVISVLELSFHDQLEIHGAGLALSNHVGTFIHIDLPRIINDHQLFSVPGVCPIDAVWFTDADVLFWNKIEWSDIEQLMHMPPGAVIKYGDEWQFCKKVPENTGSLVINVSGLAAVHSAFIAHGNASRFSFPAWDQGWLNSFIRDRDHGPRLWAYLHPQWNWKVYWGDDDLIGPKVVHFHGPKPGRGFWLQCAHPQPSCPIDMGGEADIPVDTDHPYHTLVHLARKADNAAMAHRAQQCFNRLNGAFQRMEGLDHWEGEPLHPCPF